MLSTLQSQIEQRTNSGAAALNRQRFIEAGVLAVVVTGGPSCGKTALIREALKHLSESLQCGVILGNIKAQQDADELGNWCPLVAPIETIDLNAELLREAVEKIDLAKLDVLFIERASAAPPMPEDLGQLATVGIFSVAGGDDKVARHPEHIRHADLVVLSKCDLLPVVPFDREHFRAAVHRVNPDSPVLDVSAASHAGLDAFCQWIRDGVHKIRRVDRETPAVPFTAEYFVG